MKRLIRKLGDKLLLLISALVAGLGIYGFIFFLHKTGIRRGWILFILSCISYSGIVIYLAMTITHFRECRRKAIPSLMLGLVTLAPIALAFVVFYSGLLSLPNFVWQYAIAIFILIPTSVICFEYCLNWWQKRSKGAPKNGRTLRGRT